MYIVASRYIEKNTEITINHQAPVPSKQCNCGDPSTCTASISPVPPVTTPPIPVVPKSSSSSPLIDPTVSNSSDDENKPQRNKRTRQQRNMKKPIKKMMRRTLPKVDTPPPPTSPPLPPQQSPPLLPVKSKEPNGPGRPKSPVKKVETSPEPDRKSNNNDNKLVKRLNEMVIHFVIPKRLNIF